MPDVTLPKTTCLPFNHGVWPVQMKTEMCVVVVLLLCCGRDNVGYYFGMDTDVFFKYLRPACSNVKNAKDEEGERWTL